MSSRCGSVRASRVARAQPRQADRPRDGVHARPRGRRRDLRHIPSRPERGDSVSRDGPDRAGTAVRDTVLCLARDQGDHRRCLWNKYSRVLDIRIAGTPADFILWDAIDIRAEFADPRPPAAQHLCIAILILEGAVGTIASANWDGFIEAAVNRLSGGVEGVVQVVVDPAQMRDPPGRAQLLKFHGCIVHATEDPDRYRPYLTGSHTQINRVARGPAVRGDAQPGRGCRHEQEDAGARTLDPGRQPSERIHEGEGGEPLAVAMRSLRRRARFLRGRDHGSGSATCCGSSTATTTTPTSSDIHNGSHIRAWAEQVLIALVLRVVYGQAGEADGDVPRRRHWESGHRRRS